MANVLDQSKGIWYIFLISKCRTYDGKEPVADRISELIPGNMRKTPDLVVLAIYFTLYHLYSF